MPQTGSWCVLAINTSSYCSYYCIRLQILQVWTVLQKSQMKKIAFLVLRLLTLCQRLVVAALFWHYHHKLLCKALPSLALNLASWNPCLACQYFCCCFGTVFTFFVSSCRDASQVQYLQSCTVTAHCPAQMWFRFFGSVTSIMCCMTQWHIIYIHLLYLHVNAYHNTS